MHPSLPVSVAASAYASGSSRRRSVWPWFLAFLGLGFLMFLTLVLATVFSFRIGGEARALRGAVLDSAPGEWQRQIEFGVGRLPALAVRTATRFLPAVDPRARAGLRAFHGADIAIYRRCAEGDAGTRRAVIDRVSRVMAERHWEPVVTVLEGREAVGVFVPSHDRTTDRMQACVLVMDEEQLVIVSGRVDLGPLLPLVDEALGPKLLALRH